jgi:BirA family biotin operon repressor/biotin-[acetyl-CoA-carboxylase] ligase
MFVGKPIVEFDEIGSTNAYAEEWLAATINSSSKSKPNDGTVISAANQTQGRGQIGSQWLSQPDKNLACSFIFYPNFLQPNDQFYLNKTIAIAVRQFVDNELKKYPKNAPPPVQIKWSNDIYVGERKICGILIQNQLKTNEIEHAIVGIGLNVNQLQFDPNLPNPTSLAREAHAHDAEVVEFDRAEMLHLLCKFIEFAYLHLKNCARNQDFSSIDAEYWQHLYRLNHLSQFRRRINQTYFSGRIVGTSDTGKLMVENADSLEIEEFDVKEITFVS